MPFLQLISHLFTSPVQPVRSFPGVFNSNLHNVGRMVYEF